MYVEGIKLRVKLWLYDIHKESICSGNYSIFVSNITCFDLWELKYFSNLVDFN